MKIKNKALRFFIIFSVILFSVIGLGLIVLSPYLYDIVAYRNNALAIARESSIDDFKSTQTSIIYDINGEEITTISGAMELYYLEWEQIPEIVKLAFVVTEDKKFYSHNGIDLMAIMRSVIANVKNKSIEQGASTITQQLVKNIYLTQDVTWSRKITEMFLSLEIEKKYSKNKILEFYINNVYYANGYYGIEAAAQGYFDKPAEELSLSELVFLVAIPNNPSRYDPVAHFDNTIVRRDRILGILYGEGYLSTDLYKEALNEEIELNRSEKTKSDYVETYVYYCATRALMEKNGFKFRYSFGSEADEEAYNQVYDNWYSKYQRTLFTNGYRIYTSIDMDKQEILQKYVNGVLSGYTDTNDEGVYKMQGAAVCIDNETGYVTAIVGGRDQQLPGYTLNRAYQSYRQSGSTIKPLNVYAPFLMFGNNPDYPVDDSPMESGPVNSDGLYLGKTTVQEALAWSSNVVAWKLYEEITPEHGMSFLRKMNFKRLGDDDDLMATCLGGFTYGVSSVEMAAGFATLENDGVYREPTTIMCIKDSKYEVLVDNSSRDVPVYDSNAARMISSILKHGVEAGLAKDAALDNAIVAVKTGTTSNNKDGWTVGYSDYYTTAVWVGYDIPQSDETLTGGSYPLAIWHDFMEEIHEGLEIVDFPEYEPYTDGKETESESAEDESLNASGSGAGNKGENNRYPYGDQDATMSGDADANLQGDADSNINAGGDKDANLPGDANAEITTGGDKDSHLPGDANANITTGGDKDSNLPGDANANITTGGDKDSNLPGDANANITTGGDKDANLPGDADANIITGGDKDANLPGDADANINIGGDKDANLKGDADANINIGGDQDANLPGDADANINVGGDRDANLSGDADANIIMGGDQDANLPGDADANIIMGGDQDANLPGDADANIIMGGDQDVNMPGDADANIIMGGDRDAFIN